MHQSLVLDPEYMQPPSSALSSGRSQTASGYERPPLNSDSNKKSIDDFQLKDDLGIEQTLYTSPENIHSPVDYTDPNNDIDPSDVTDRELAGWYGYGFAAEAYG